MLALLAEGLRNADISAVLHISPKTVDHHVSAILAKLDVLGSPDTYNHYSIGWAFAFNTPNKMFKRHTREWEWPTRCSCTGPGRQGHGRDPRSLRPLQRRRPNGVRGLGIEPPEVVRGFTQWPLDGTSFGYSFDDASGASPPDIDELRRSLRAARWKAAAPGRGRCT